MRQEQAYELRGIRNSYVFMKIYRFSFVETKLFAAVRFCIVMQIYNTIAYNVIQCEAQTYENTEHTFSRIKYCTATVLEGFRAYWFLNIWKRASEIDR